MKFSKERNKYGYYYDEEKQRVFGKIGQANFYDDIQSFADSTDINYIKKTLLENSESVPDGAYFDTTFMTNDLLLNLNKADEAKRLFDSLPLSLKQKYGNNIYTFYNQYKKEDLDTIIPILKDDENQKDIKVENRGGANDEI